MQYRLRIEGEDGLSVDRLVAKELVLRMLQLEEWNLPGSTSRAATASTKGAALSRRAGRERFRSLDESELRALRWQRVGDRAVGVA